MLGEYIPFIVLLFSLYTISGGIRIEGDLPAHPLTNTAFLAVGGVLASFIGTTGAAMLLIRPLLETNRERKHVAAHGRSSSSSSSATAAAACCRLGDPPLFLGYLKGVPFLWTLRLWTEWLFVNGCLLAIYYRLGPLLVLPARDAAATSPATRRRVRRLRIRGLWPNAVLLLGVILSRRAARPGQGRARHELGIRGCTCARSCSWGWSACRWRWAARDVRQANHFNYDAHRRGGRAVLRHLHLHAAAAADPGRPRAATWD